MRQKLAIIHTTPVTVEPLKALAAELLPGVTVVNFVDDSVLPQLAEGGEVASVAPRLVQYARFAEEVGADALLSACSSVGEVAAEMRRAVRIPVVRIDEAMAEEAVRRGGRVGVAATLPTTLRPTLALLEAKAREARKEVEPLPLCVEGAYARLAAGDREGHDALLTDALASLAARVDTVVLAQASMARVLPELPEALRGKFLTSPRLGMARVRDVLSARELMPGPDNLLTLTELLPVAQRHGFAVGSFSPRYPKMIPPILRAAQGLGSPLIVQISQKDMARCGVAVAPFAEAFYGYLRDLEITVPVTLHLDHTEEPALIEAAIDAGFSSVMIDASDRPLAENVALTRAVADAAHARGVSVEGELGTIGAFGFSETEATDEAAMTDPAQVESFVKGARVDALAVSVGTVHGVREGSSVAIDVERLRLIRERTEVPLVLHGGSGVHAEALVRAIRVPGGGVSKVNLATDLELAMLRALGSEARLLDAHIEALSEAELKRAQAAVEGVVREKIASYLLSDGGARHYAAGM